MQMKNFSAVHATVRFSDVVANRSGCAFELVKICGVAAWTARHQGKHYFIQQLGRLIHAQVLERHAAS